MPGERLGLARADHEDHTCGEAVAADLLRRVDAVALGRISAGRYAGPDLRAALGGAGHWTIEVVKRSDAARGFQVVSLRWVVERTFVWLRRCRRSVKEWDRSIASAEA